MTHEILTDSNISKAERAEGILGRTADEVLRDMELIIEAKGRKPNERNVEI